MKVRAIFLRLLQPVLRSLVEAFQAGDEDVIRAVDFERTLERISDFLRTIPGAYFLSLVAILFAFEFALSPLSGRWRPFSFLPLKERVQVLEIWTNTQQSWKKTLFLGIRFLILSHIYSEPGLLDQIGYGRALRERQEGLC